MTKDELYEIPGQQIYEWLLNNAILTSDERFAIDNMDDGELREFALDFIK